MGDEDHGAPVGQPQRLELGVERVAGQGVEGAERLVEEQDRRVGDERPCQGDALLHPAGELARPEIGRVRQPDLGQRPLPCLAALGGGHAVQLEREGHVVERVAPAEEPWLLEDEPDPAITGARR